uniref:Ig-like domain-containing protein n=2 Tax=Timema TaxID=61471 RepID=A0A7R9HQI8_9NEOP|nr:unnamed protein product [Timema cristinae]CAD7428848.1 unnamed protein product [Timema monikensis]
MSEIHREEFLGRLELFGLGDTSSDRVDPPFPRFPNEEPKSPVFKTFPQSATLQEGESVSFNCETEKVPLKVTWLKDGKPVDETSSKYQFVQDGKKKFKFEITNCNSLDVGQYTAKAVGKKGETTAAFSLNVCPTGEL